jgi:Lytic transglycolase
VAAWAVALSLFLILVASASSRADTTGGAGVVPAGGSEDGGSQLLRSPPPQLEALPSGATRKEVLARMSVRLASWYGPGFYGRRTACGLRLRRSTQGVAHKSLPCGTPVTFYHRGRLKTVTVIDRGPYARRVSWDLTAATARGLGLRRNGPIRALAWQPTGG